MAELVVVGRLVGDVFRAQENERTHCECAFDFGRCEEHSSVLSKDRAVVRKQEAPERPDDLLRQLPDR